MEVVEGNYFGASGDRLIRRLGEAFCGWKRGRVRTLNDLARADLPVPDGVVLTDEAHEAFLEASGLLEGLRVPTWPVLIQREISPLYTGWSTTGSATSQEASAGQASGEKKGGLYDVEPADGEGNQRQS